MAMQLYTSPGLLGCSELQRHIFRNFSVINMTQVSQAINQQALTALYLISFIMLSMSTTLPWSRLNICARGAPS